MAFISPYYYNYYSSMNLLNSFTQSTSSQGISLDQLMTMSEQAGSINSYNSQLPTNVINSLTSFNNYANNLLQASTPLQTTSYDNIFQQTVATSSSSSISVQSQSGATQSTYNVTVSQLAAAQQNTGTSLSSSAATGLSAGTYTLNIQSNNTNYSVNFNVNAGDTNQTVLSNMATAINNVGSGVTAKVNNDTNLGTSTLVLNSNSTGTNNAFTITDISGNAVSYTGAGNTTTTSANASYSVNGVSNTSQSNTVSLDNQNVSMTFSGLATNATVTVSPDTQAVNSAISNFVNNYNNLVNYANQNQQYISPDVIGSLEQSYQYQSANLASIGITQNSDMTLSIDQSTLSSALKNNFSQVQDAFSGLDGLAVNTGQIAQNITSSPLTTYVNPSVYEQQYNSLATYNYLGMLDTSNIISQLLPSGSMFNTTI